MSRYTGPTTRLSRKLGVMLFTNSESKIKAYNKKKYKPGMHGQKRFSQLSEYGKHLQEKQKVKVLFGITEKQCRKYYEMANKSSEITGEKLMKILEQRLDNTIFRSGIGATRPQARQIVGHGLIKLNGKKVTIPSIIVEKGDIFEVLDKKKSSKLFEALEKRKIKAPKWLKVDLKSLKGEVVTLPDKDDIENVIDSQLITEFYSK
ncbi:30S ribosomal protein S4 [Candidatus Peregrinibacteria bacterium]|nr:30S ribosomal protein S4 [Candidatus Peregrinibacteria bacterium]